MKIKQFLTNTQDPKSKYTQMFFPRSLHESPQDAWKNHLAYLSDKVIGRPQGTPYFSVSELEKQGMVGVYKEMGLREWLAYRWMLVGHWYKRKFVYRVKYETNQNH